MQAALATSSQPPQRKRGPSSQDKMGWSTKNHGKESQSQGALVAKINKAEAAIHRNRRNHHPSSRRKTIPSSHPQHLNNITLVPVPFTTTSIWNKFTTSSHLALLVPLKSTPIRMRIEDTWGVRIPQRVEKEKKKIFLPKYFW